MYPEINAMQVRAILEAALELVKSGKNPRPCIEVPLGEDRLPASAGGAARSLAT